MLRFLHTLILCIFASTRSWSTIFCAWETLLLVHILPGIAFSVKSLQQVNNLDSSSQQIQIFTWGCAGVQSDAPLSLITPSINCWGQFKHFVTLKVIQHRVENVTDITRHLGFHWCKYFWWRLYAVLNVWYIFIRGNEGNKYKLFSLANNYMSREQICRIWNAG